MINTYEGSSILPTRVQVPWPASRLVAVELSRFVETKYMIDHRTKEGFEQGLGPGLEFEGFPGDGLYKIDKIDEVNNLLQQHSEGLQPGSCKALLLLSLSQSQLPQK